MAMELMIIGLLLILMAGTVHGALGLGFPMLATPVLALAYDLKTAVLLTMIPSLVVITLSLCNCRNIKGTVRQYGLIIVSNTCFLLSKFMQLIILLTHLTPDEIELIPLALITMVACTGLFAGFRLQARINAERYRVIIRYVLSVFMCVLAYQGLTSLSPTL